jgi:hypothetical protein
MDAKKLASLFDNPKFANWFQGSRVAKKSGEPIPLYRTERAARDIIEPSDNGLIFMSPDDEYVDNFANGHKYELFANIKKPVDFREFAADQDVSAADWHEFLDRNGIDMGPDYKKSYRDSGEILQHVSQFNRGGKLRDAMQKSGYDGVVLREYFEDPDNSAVSYAAFAPNQVKSAENAGTFDPSNPNIYKSVLPYAAVGGGLMAAMSPNQAQAIDRIRQNDLPIEEAWNPVEAFGGGLGGGLKAAATGVLPDGAMDWAFNKLGGLMSWR